MLFLISSSLLLTPLLSHAAYVNNSDYYTNGTMGISPSTWAWDDHFWPLFNFNPFPAEPPQEGYLLYAPRGTNVSKPGAYIVAWNGSLIWDGSDYGETMSFSTQTYLGNEVLTLWVGDFKSGGYGYGKQVILDKTYNVVANITTTLADQNVTNDFHEFLITPNDTALIDMYITSQYDLSSYNVTGTGGGQGWIIAGAAQEIDIQTGQALWTWNSLDHVDPGQCYSNPGETGATQDNGWDYFHLNAVEKDSKGNFLLSSRHCHALYYVSGQNGSIIWTIGGRNSTFDMGDKTSFAWQHDARWQENETQISIFDNGASNWEITEPVARGIILNIHMDNMSVTLDREFLAPTNKPSVSQGSMELQPNGNWLIGWGSQPYMTEFYPNGTVAWSLQFGLSGVQTYRVHRSNWTAYPQSTPFVNFDPRLAIGDGYHVDLSWNGATEVEYWLVQASSSSDGTGMSSVSSGEVSNFQTSIDFERNAVSGKDYIQGVAFAANGSILGYTDFWSVSQDSTVPRAPNQSQAVTVGTASFTAVPTSASTPASSESGGAVAAMDLKGASVVLASVLGIVCGMRVVL